jgi:two-component system, OmpR family, alkaline phosphatase synthesis response regulator PhoP
MQKPLKILIADDEADIVEFLTYNLSKENFEIYRAYSGHEAILLATKNLPDLIIMDIWMPDLTGIEVCRVIKRNEILKDIPVLMLTADSDEYTGLRAHDAGCDHFITKPVKVAFLVKLVKEILQPIPFEDL